MSKLERFSRAVGYGVGTVWAGADIALNHPASPLFRLNPFTATMEQAQARVIHSPIYPINYGAQIKVENPDYYEQIKGFVGDKIDQVFMINVVRIPSYRNPLFENAYDFQHLLVYVDGDSKTPLQFYIGLEDMIDESGFASYELVLQAIHAMDGQLLTDQIDKRKGKTLL